ncbi:MAG: holo-ACP synthase [Micrococcales bacterium 73-13]|nr:MAG: holo-ACP synthase [Micrococcales bacterium 73-13]
MGVIGVGVDLVDIARFERAMGRTPRLRARLFAEDELSRDGRPLPLRSLAGRFAAKEAFIKALGGSDEIGWHDMPVVSDEHGNPGFALRGRAAETAGALGVAGVHLTMSHDAGLAVAFVVVED